MRHRHTLGSDRQQFSIRSVQPKLNIPGTSASPFGPSSLTGASERVRGYIRRLEEDRTETETVLHTLPSLALGNSPLLRMIAYDLPIEIWQQIFVHACTDGGYTGTALAQVSKLFYEASHPIRFRSLSFTSLLQIQAFLAYVRGPSCVHPQNSPQIHHLMLSFSNLPHHDTCQEQTCGATDTPDNDNYLWFRARRLREEEKATWDEWFSMVVSRLLDLVAPHLETLALLQSDGFAIPPIRHTLPNLRELTLLIGVSVMLNEGDIDICSSRPALSSSQPLSGRLSDAPMFLGRDADGTTSLVAPATPSSGSGDMSGLPATGRFPALERLHVICGRHRDWTLRDALDALSRLAPALTHLRISNATYTHGQDDYISSFLHHTLGLPARRVAESGLAPIELGVDRGGRVLADLPVGINLQQEVTSIAAMENVAADLGDNTVPRGDGHAKPTPGPDSSPARAILSDLRHVVVHSVPPPPGYQFGAPYKDYRTLVDSIKAVVVACDQAGDGVRVRWTESERVQNRHWEQLIKMQWTDRCEGGCGCWESDVDVSDTDADARTGFS